MSRVHCFYVKMQNKNVPAKSFLNKTQKRTQRGTHTPILPLLQAVTPDKKTPPQHICFKQQYSTRCFTKVNILTHLPPLPDKVATVYCLFSSPECKQDQGQSVDLISRLDKRSVAMIKSTGLKLG